MIQNRRIKEGDNLLVIINLGNNLWLYCDFVVDVMEGSVISKVEIHNCWIQNKHKEMSKDLSGILESLGIEENIPSFIMEHECTIINKTEIDETERKTEN